MYLFPHCVLKSDTSPRLPTNRLHHPAIGKVINLNRKHALRAARSVMIAVMQEAETEDRALGGPRRMLNEKQVLEIIPVSRTTLFRIEKAGRFPRSTYISPNRRIWFADEIIAWQNAVDEFNPNRGRGKGRRARASS
jgi:prophage regulatory protein